MASIPSAVSILFLKAIISFSGLSAERSGSKCGRIFKSLQTVKAEKVFCQISEIATKFFICRISTCTSNNYDNIFLFFHSFVCLLRLPLIWSHRGISLPGYSQPCLRGALHTHILDEVFVCCLVN